MYRSATIIPVALLCASPAATRAETDAQQWLTVSAGADLSPSLAVHGETVARFSDGSGGLYEIESSLLLGYALSDNISLWLGYVHNPTYADGDFSALERRFRQQAQVDDLARIGTALLGGRVRVEQRWRDGADRIAWRLRPYLKLSIPLGDALAPTLGITTEPFINVNTTAFQTTAGLDRLRSAISVSVPINETVRVEAGYLNQHSFVRGGEDGGDHALTAAIALSF